MAIESAAVGTAIRALRTISEIAKNANNIDLTQKVIELQNSILEMQQEMTLLSDDNRSLKNQVEEQRRLREIHEDMDFVEDGGFFVRKSERAAGRSIPYCPICWRDNDRCVPLNPLRGRGAFQCDIHHSSYQTAAYRDRLARQEPVSIGRTHYGPWS